MSGGITTAIISIIAITIISAGAGGDKKKDSKKLEDLDKIETKIEEELPDFTSTENIEVTKDVVVKKKNGRYDSNFVKEVDEKVISNFIEGHYHRVSEKDRTKISKWIAIHGNEHELDPKFIAALVARESGFNKKAVSRRGAKGLGQLVDANLKAWDVKDPFDIEENLLATTRHFKVLLDKWSRHKKGTSLALASYKAGYHAVKNCGGRLSGNTISYINDIYQFYSVMKSGAQKFLNN